jgi:glycosyltransferase involved in cell wall biosynthesis
MRIAVVHSFYSSRTPSGENDVVLAQVQSLVRAGHEVALLARHTDEAEKTRAYAVQSGLRVATGWGPNPLDALGSFRPEILHVHNLFPNFGTSWMRQAPVPVVASMHNYRQVCANGLLYRDGEPCFECRESTWAAVRHSCYRQSRLATLPLAWSTRGGAEASALLTCASAVVVPSERARTTFLDLGVPEPKLRMIPYFIEDAQPDASSEATEGVWLVAGRLSQEKGVRELMDIWPDTERLDVAGSGPDEGALRAMAPSNVHFLGQLSQRDLYSQLPRYEGLIFPGRSPEGIPTMVLHAIAAGIPVVARPGNGAGDLARDVGVGAVYARDAQTTLLEALGQIRTGGPTLRRHCRTVFEEHFTETAWLQQTEVLYASLTGTTLP